MEFWVYSRKLQMDLTPTEYECGWYWDMGWKRVPPNYPVPTTMGEVVILSDAVEFSLAGLDGLSQLNMKEDRMDNERCEFAKAVKAMVNASVLYGRGSYVSFADAAPFVANLPEFWREPARVMACCGYYASADEWIKEHAE